LPASPQEFGLFKGLPALYWFVRALLRLWFGFWFRSIRVLNGEPLLQSGALVVTISRPPNFLAALVLVASSERQLHCALDRSVLQGVARRTLAWTLGMIPYDSGVDGGRSIIEPCCRILTDQGAIAVFVKAQGPGAEGALRAELAAQIPLEAQSGWPVPLEVALVPVHLLLPVTHAGADEAMVHLGTPIFLEQISIGSETTLAEKASLLGDELRRAGDQNPFALRPDNIEHFMGDLHELFRADLQEEWGQRKNWRQDIEGLRLSQFVAQWVGYVNRTDPGRLVALHRSLHAYQEARRRWSLRRLEVETAQTWMRSWWRRRAVAVESLLGLPVALYGAVNHLLAGFALCGLSLFRKVVPGAGTGAWIRWALVVSCDAAQVALVGHWLGRSTAGYYLLTLPISGAYLWWRYVWLVRNRTRLLIAAHWVRGVDARLVRDRKQFIEEFNAARDSYAASLSGAHTS